MRVLTSLLLALSLLSMTACSHDSPEVSRSVRGFAVGVLVPGGGASGSIIRHRGHTHVLTAAHVVQGFDEALVESFEPSQVRRTARVVHRDEGVDLALLDVDDLRPGRGARLLPLTSLFSPGEECWYAGWTEGLPLNLDRTVISRELSTALFVHGSAFYGHSGAGVFVRRPGRRVLLAGVILGGISSSPRTPTRCATIAQIHSFLESVPCD